MKFRGLIFLIVLVFTSCATRTARSGEKQGGKEIIHSGLETRLMAVWHLRRRPGGMCANSNYLCRKIARPCPRVVSIDTPSFLPFLYRILGET